MFVHFKGTRGSIPTAPTAQEIEENPALESGKENDDDFEKKKLYDMDIDQLEAMKDNRRSGYWELSWL